MCLLKFEFSRVDQQGNETSAVCTIYIFPTEHQHLFHHSWNFHRLITVDGFRISNQFRHGTNPTKKAYSMVIRHPHTSPQPRNQTFAAMGFHPVMGVTANLQRCGKNHHGTEGAWRVPRPITKLRKFTYFYILSQGYQKLENWRFRKQGEEP